MRTSTLHPSQGVSLFLPRIGLGQLKVVLRYLSYLVPLCVFGVCTFIASRMTPGFADESVYHYDAWAAWAAPSGVSQSFVPYIHQGYLLGLPYLFFDHPGYFGIRLWSFFLWMSGNLIFYWGFARRLREAWLVPLLSGFFLYSMFVGTLSYQTLPFVFLAAAGGLFLVACEKESSPTSRIAALLCPILSSLIVVAYFPSLPTAVFAFLCGLTFVPRDGRKQRFVLAAFFSALIVIFILALEREYASDAVIVSLQTNSLGLWRKFYRWLGLIEHVAFKPVMYGLGLALPILCVSIISPLKRRFLEQPVFRWLFCGALVAYAGCAMSPQFGPELWLPPTPYAFVFLCLLFLLPTLLLAHYYAFGLSLVPWIPLLWLGMIAGTEGILGSGKFPFYARNTGPALLGLGLLLVASHANRPGTRWIKALVVVFSLTFTGYSILRGLHRGYHGANALSAHYELPGKNFNNTWAHYIRSGTVKEVARIYTEFGCDAKFFAVIDRSTLVYLITERASPFGDSFIGNRRDEYFQRIRDQDSVCLFYRTDHNRPVHGKARTIWDYIDLPRPEYKVRADFTVGTEGLAFAAFEKRKKFRNLSPPLVPIEQL